MLTMGTAFGRRIPEVNLDEVPPVPFCFVFELRHECTPANVGDRFKSMILDHVFHSKALHADRLVFTDQASGESVQEIMASISYSGMDTRHLLEGSYKDAFLFIGGI